MQHAPMCWRSWLERSLEEEGHLPDSKQRDAIELHWQDCCAKVVRDLGDGAACASAVYARKPEDACPEFNRKTLHYGAK
jgi:hypothetical protein